MKVYFKFFFTIRVLTAGNSTTSVDDKLEKLTSFSTIAKIQNVAKANNNNK